MDAGNLPARARPGNQAFGLTGHSGSAGGQCRPDGCAALPEEGQEQRPRDAPALRPSGLLGRFGVGGAPCLHVGGNLCFDGLHVGCHTCTDFLSALLADDRVGGGRRSRSGLRKAGQGCGPPKHGGGCERADGPHRDYFLHCLLGRPTAACGQPMPGGKVRPRRVNFNESKSLSRTASVARHGGGPQAGRDRERWRR